MKLRRSALNRPATKKPNVSAADSIGVENVEKNTAIAVTTDSSTKVSAIDFRSAGSSAGRSQAFATTRVGHPSHDAEHRVERERHDGQIDRQRQHEPGVFAEHDLIALDRLREQA